MQKGLITQEEHDMFKDNYGFKDIGSRCPVCYIEGFIIRKVRDALIKQEQESKTRLEVFRKEIGVGREEDE